MEHSTFETARTHANLVPMRLEKIPSPFVWTPRELVPLRIAVVAGNLRERAHTATVLRSSGHHVAPYPAADPLIQRLQSQDRTGQGPLEPYALDAVILHGSGNSDEVVAALEKLRAHGGAIPIVLVADDDSDLLAAAKRLCVEEVLAPPVHPVALRAAVAAAVFLPADELVIDSELEAF